MMNQDFDAAAYEAFQQAALDKYDFTTCQRPDGSKYGSNGRCIKGSETSPASKDDKKGSSKSGGGSASSSSGGGDVATAPAPKKTTSKDPVKNVLNEQQKTKDFLKKDNAQMAKNNPKLAKMQKDMEARKAKEKAAREGKSDPFAKQNAQAKKIEADLRKKYANKKPDGGLTEAQVRAGGGRLD